MYRCNQLCFTGQPAVLLAKTITDGRRKLVSYFFFHSSGAYRYH